MAKLFFFSVMYALLLFQYLENKWAWTFKFKRLLLFQANSWIFKAIYMWPCDYTIDHFEKHSIYTISYLISPVIRNLIAITITCIHVLLHLNQKKIRHENSRKHTDELLWTKFYFDNYLISWIGMSEWCTMTNFSLLKLH